MANTIACPEVTRFRLLALGQLPEAENEPLLAHLEGCDTCARRLSSLPERDTLAELVRQSSTISEADTGEVLGRLVARLSALRPGLAETVTPAPAASLAFACAGCGQPLRVKPEFAGRKTACPKCKRPLEVPLPSSPDTSAERRLYDFLAPSQAADELGRLGPYRVLKVLGAGGMGIVFLAEDTQLARPVALKAMLPALASGMTARQRFLREARAAAAIKHDHVVTIYQVGEDRGVPYLAMELLAGEPLETRLERDKVLPLKEILRIGRELAVGLGAAHEKGLIHRDIKPANIWLETGTGRVKVLDFGLARAGSGEGQLTQSGAIVGTPAYMAPEQAQGKTIDGRADLFSLGCVLYRMVTGQPAFKGTDIISTLLAVATETPRPPREVNAAVPAALSNLIVRLLAKSPEARPESAQAVAAELVRMGRPAAPVKPAAKPPALPVQPPAIQPAPKSPAKAIAQPPVKPTPRVVSAHRWGLWVAVAMGLLGILLTGLWAVGVLFKVRTPDGTLVIEVNEPNPEVYVDGALVTVTWDNGGKKAEIRIKPGTRKVEVKKGGFTIHGEEVTIEDGGRQILVASLAKPAPVPMPGPGPMPGPIDVPSPIPTPEEFVSLFNGKDLTGWVVESGDAKQWKVQPEEVMAESADWRDQTWVLSEKRYSDFTLRMDFKVAAGASGAVAIRASPGERMPDPGKLVIPIHPMIKLTDEAKWLQEPLGTTHWMCSGKRFVKPKFAADLRSGWNELELLVRGSTLLARVNGKIVIDTKLDEAPESGLLSPGLQRRDGHIAFQAHTGRITFRKIEIKELRATAPPSDGFTPLFNGKDLMGWSAEVQDLKRWTVNDGEIVGIGGMGLLRTDKEYTNFILNLEFKVGVNSNGGVAFRLHPDDLSNPSPTNMYVHVKCVRRVPEDRKMFGISGAFYWGLQSGFTQPDPEPQLKSAEEWNTLTMQVQGEELRVWVNGRQVQNLSLAHLAARTNAVPGLTRKFGKIGLQRHTGEIRFRKIEIKELPAVTGSTKPPQPVEGETRYLVDLKEFGYEGEGRVFNEIVGGSIKVDGTKYAKGLWLHPRNKSDASVKYSLQGLGAKQFNTRIAINDTTGQAACPLLFEVFGDDKLLWQSRPAQKSRIIQECSIDVAGVSVLKLRVVCGGNGGNIEAHAVWLDPHLILGKKMDGEQASRTPMPESNRNPDRTAAEYVLSIGGTVRVNNEGRDIRVANELPREPFQLTRVHLEHGERATDAGLAAFKGCKHVSYLHLRNRTVGDAGLSHFKDCKQMKWLLLYYTQVTSDGLAAFAGCNDLFALGLNGCSRVGDVGMVHFKDCKELTGLELSGTRVGDAGLAYFKDCKKLDHLRMNTMQMTDVGLANFKDCRLVGVELSTNPKLSDEGIAQLNLKSIDWIYLSGTKVTDKTLARLKDCDKVAEIRLYGTQVTAAGVADLKQAKPRCRIDWDGSK